MLKMELNIVQSVNQSTSLLMNQPNFRFHALSVNFVGIKSCEYVITLVGKTIFVAFVEDNATMSSIRYFENHVSYFVQNRRK